MSSDELTTFSTLPLLNIPEISRFVTLTVRADCALPEISGDLPFDVRSHSQAQSAVAKSMLSRLSTDMHDYAKSQNMGKTPRLQFLQSAHQDFSKLSHLLTQWLAVQSSRSGSSDSNDSSSGSITELISEFMQSLQRIKGDSTDLISCLETVRQADAAYVHR